MCLEDRLLLSLYNQQGPVPISTLSDTIFITENAALSIVHRVQACYPDYILVKDEAADGNLVLSANQSKTDDVQKFLAEGGFTAINEKEFLEYYNKELDKEKKLEQLKRAMREHAWMRWLTGVGVTIASGLAVTGFVKSLKKGGRNFYSFSGRSRG